VTERKAFDVRVKRTEHYHTVIRVPGESEAQVKEKMEHLLNSEGWDAICADEGDYDCCWSEVDAVDEIESK
jgi:hypothetical protein